MLRPRVLQGKSSRDIFLHVVTPDRIPQFIIPSLDIDDKDKHSAKGKGEAERTARRSSWDPAVKDEHNLPTFSSYCYNSRLAATAQAVPDPMAWATLSLPHLPKVTTPYGFVTLGQSPQVTSEEAFFHSGSGSSGSPAAGGGGYSWMGGHLRDCKQPSPHVTGHKDGGDSQARRGASPVRDPQITGVLESREAEKRERRLLELGYQRSNPSLVVPTGTPRKNLLPRFFRKHLAHPRHLKPMNFSLH